MSSGIFARRSGNQLPAAPRLLRKRGALHMRNGRLNSTPIIALVLAAACWGAATVITKHVLANIPPLTLLVLQLTISVSFLWLIVFAQRLTLPQRRDIVRLGGIGILNPGLAYTFGLLGLTRTTASMSTLLWAAEPILILVLAWLILRERLTGRWLPRHRPRAYSARGSGPCVRRAAGSCSIACPRKRSDRPQAPR